MHGKKHQKQELNHITSKYRNQIISPLLLTAPRKKNIDTESQCIILWCFITSSHSNPNKKTILTAAKRRYIHKHRIHICCYSIIDGVIHASLIGKFIMFLLPLQLECLCPSGRFCYTYSFLFGKKMHHLIFFSSVWLFIFSSFNVVTI